ncbi:pre-mRNA-splicing regulator WTAP-like [Anneissia japonica]|uniref:pre-mRNA-splicing regulator WTAP-like n=1 Tax=Anneissia japonica TaxID=1529436 RepID=UPI00142588FE|nr:pre-mRNA-splicing regulator WTAP-like [Anneissia japonica]XP_033117869.1 pre-mRNA-splicing regulator WTAP-like [Anneissia japonica]
MSEESPAPKRVRLSNEEMTLLSKEDMIAKWMELEMYTNELEKKQTEAYCGGDMSSLEEKWKQHQLESSRKEKVLVMRLTTKEQEVQELSDLSKAQNPSTTQLQNSLLDPAINLLFQRMRKETEDSKTKLQQANDDMAAWKFTPDSQTGKRLMLKCRTLLQENQDLGKQISSGKTAQLEAELALQKKYSEELKTSQDEMNDFVIELDEEVEGMQSTICTLQQQLKDCKAELAKYKSQCTLETPVNSNGHNMANTAPSDHQQTYRDDAYSLNTAAISAEKYNAPIRTDSGPFTVSTFTSNLSVELEGTEGQDESYRTTRSTEYPNTARPGDTVDKKMSAGVQENNPDENQDSEFDREQFFKIENQEEVQEKYGWEGDDEEILRINEGKKLKIEYVDESPGEDSKTADEDQEPDEQVQDGVEKFRTDSLIDVRNNVNDDNDDDTGNETPTYGELSDTEQNNRKHTDTDQLLVCKIESTYKPNNILTVDPIQKSLPNDVDEDDMKELRTDSPVNGRALIQHSAIPLDSAKISLVDCYSSDDGGGSVELSTTKTTVNLEHNGLHKLSDEREDECIETD